MPEIMHEIEIRRAKRAIAPDTVREDIVDRIMKAATLAPSCANKQPWRFVVVTGDDSLERVRKHLSEGNYWALTSPFIVCIAVKPEEDCRLSDRRDYAFFDAGLAVMNLILQATHEGLYAHPIAGYNPEEIKKELGIPEDYILINLVILGYPGDESRLGEKHLAQEHGDRERKPMDQVIFRDEWPVK